MKIPAVRVWGTAGRTFKRLLILGALCGMSSGDFPSTSADVLVGGLSPRLPAGPLGPVEEPLFQIDPDEASVRRYIGLYTAGWKRRRMQAALDRMAMYRPMVRRLLAEGGLPAELACLPLVESEYFPSAVSRAGAAGLWQFMASTGRCYGLKVNYWQDDRYDPERATAAAVRHLKDLHLWFEDWALALAAYNRGLGGVSLDLARTRAADFADAARRNGLPPETREYVPNMKACILIARDPERFGFKLNEARAPEAEEVLLNRPLDLRIAAACAGTTEKVLRELNPALRAWCTPKSRAPSALRVPAGKKEEFLTKVAQVADWTPPPARQARPGKPRDGRR